MFVKSAHGNSKGFLILHVLRKVVNRKFSYLFVLFFLVIRIMRIDMRHMFQRIESIHKTQAGDTKTYMQNINKNIYTYLIHFEPPVHDFRG